MRTPRPSSRPNRGGFGTLIGNGWLRESPRNVIPREWNPKSRSALRKCMFMQMPADVAALVAELPPPAPSPIAAWQRPVRHEAPIVPRRHDPMKDARMMPAFDPRMLQMKAAVAPKGRAWWEDPVALGTLLIIAPPIGLACVWRSKHYSNDARWALTVMSALLTCFAMAVVLALIVVR